MPPKTKTKEKPEPVQGGLDASPYADKLAQVKEYLMKKKGITPMSNAGVVAPPDPDDAETPEEAAMAAQDTPPTADQSSSPSALQSLLMQAAQAGAIPAIPGVPLTPQAVGNLAQTAIPPAVNAVTPLAQGLASGMAGQPVGGAGAPPPQTPTPQNLPSSGGSNGAPPPMNQQAVSSAIQGASTPNPLSQLGQFNPATQVTPGLNPSDRQALAGQMMAKQHSFGSLLGEAMSGIGDAIAARGGVKQDSLNDIFTLQKQYRDEALGNFDKARQAAVENFTMKNQADQNLINNLKGQNEVQISPQTAKSLGHPEWAGLPPSAVDFRLKMDAAHVDYYNKAAERHTANVAQAAKEYDTIQGTHMRINQNSDPKFQASFISNRANDLDAQDKGLAKITQGNKSMYVSPEQAAQAMKQDPTIQREF